LPVFMPRVSVSRFALHAGLVTFRQTFVLRCLGGKLSPAGGKERFLPTRAASSSSPTAGASDAYSMHIQELGFPTRSRIARCEVGYNREKVLLVESGYNLDHQRAPFSRSGAVPEVIELSEHVAR
jgi:hypothetical protein